MMDSVLKRASVLAAQEAKNSVLMADQEMEDVQVAECSDEEME